MKDNSVSVYHRTLQILETEIFEIRRSLTLDILREIFVFKISSYDLRSNNTFERRQVHSIYHSTESISFLGPHFWGLLTLELKQLESPEVFKFKIKKCIPFGCPCRTYIHKVGFLESVGLTMMVAITIFIV